MNTVTGVITQVLERWPAHGEWLVEVEVFADGRYHHADVSTLTERDAKSIKRGDEITIQENPDDNNDLLSDIPF